VLNARSTCAVVPLALTQRLLSGASELTVKPACVSHERTAAASAAVGA
jgi:hypothetical protein